MDTMRALGMPPDLRAFNILLKGYSRTGALAALDDILEMLYAEVSCSTPVHCLAGCLCTSSLHVLEHALEPLQVKMSLLCPAQVYRF